MDGGIYIYWNEFSEIKVKIKGMKIHGFRCLDNVMLDFDDQLTLIVGENDSGKSSIIDCMKVVTQGRSVESSDFTFGADQMKLTVIIDNLEFEKIYHLQNEEVTEELLRARPTKEYLENLKTWLLHENADFSDEIEFQKLRDTARLFGIQVRSNSRAETLVDNLVNIIDGNATDPNFAIENAKFPDFNNIQLDGKQFENVSAFFKEVFLKEKQSSLWAEPVDQSNTIFDIVKHAIDGYAVDIANQLEQSGIKEKIKVFLPSLTDIKIQPDYAPQDFNLNATVKFLENGRKSI